MKPEEIFISDFTYNLPDHRIASTPAVERHDSKLLVYNNGKITDEKFINIAGHLPERSLICFNNTRVINARLKFKKKSGAVIEIFCLEPFEYKGFENNLSESSPALWNCFVGGAAKWKGEVLCMQLDEGFLNAELLEKTQEIFVIKFSWQPSSFPFSDIIKKAGKIPLPPYIRRSPEITDEERYQTVYAKQEGSVAAPTAGLHFTETVMQELGDKGIAAKYLTLHVGAGTFRPVKTENISGHAMHSEWMEVEMTLIEEILTTSDKIIAVGTTSLRTLESLYWLGVKVMKFPNLSSLSLDQWEVYNEHNTVSGKEALRSLLLWMKSNSITKLTASTQLIIVPGYKFRIVNILITNFHQPQSTLLLLVAAATKNKWKKIYDHALEHDYRFLSYGDSSLIYID